MRALVLTCALLGGGLQGLVLPAALAHSGHGDAFVQNDSVDQVKASPTQDQLLGISTDQPQVSAEGRILVPTAAILDVDGQPLVFVRSGDTYDPVLIKVGPVVADRTVVLEGVTADEQVVVSGGLSLFAESQKKDRQPVVLEKLSTPDPSGNDPSWMVPGGIAVAVIVVIAAGFGLRGRGSGRNDS